MLVLTRKLGASITIDDSIHVTVLEVRGNQVRLGIEAPADIRVRRSELSQDGGGANPGNDAGNSAVRRKKPSKPAPAS